MTHLDEGTLVAMRDGDVMAALAAEHLGACGHCAVALDEATRRSHVVAEALATLDDPVDVLRAKAAVRRRLDARRSEGPRRGWWRAHLGRAAALLLLTAGAASALPWSPVRGWWVRTPQPNTTATVEPSGTPAGTAATQGSPAGISVAVPDGRITVVVRGAQPGSEIEVVWVDRATARITAAAGSSFTYAGGRAEVDAVPGPIRVELPRAAESARLLVGDRVFLERSGQDLDVPGPVTERSDAGLRFIVPAI